jgi:glycosyltransferase involved in cell wall biosynthesis
MCNDSDVAALYSVQERRVQATVAPSRSIGFLVPGALATRTGGYLYDRRMIAGLRARGWRVDVRELDASFPFPGAAALDDAARALASFADGSIVMIDSLAFGALPDAVERERERLRIVALVHLPLAADVARDALTAAGLLRDERRALAAAALVVVTGASAIGLLEPHGVALGKIVVVEPGTDRAELARGSAGGPLRFLSVGALSSGKGHEILCRALAPLRARAWHLECVGSTTRDAPTVARVQASVASLGLSDRVTLSGELDAEGVARSYDRSDVYVTATLRETYGMAVAEALARGLPIVGTRTGAIEELVGDGAGIVVAPGDADALSAALARIIDDPALRARFAGGARRVRERLPTWEQAIGRMEAALSQIA